MANFNFLSGSSIDTSPNLLFNIFEQEECFLGFSKGTPTNQWGVNTLIQIEHTASNYLSAISTSPSVGASRFYDNNSIIKTNNLAPNDNRKIYIVKYTSNDPSSSPMYFDSAVIGDTYLTYINKSWAVIQGLVPNFYELMPYTNGLDPTNPAYKTYDYYIYNYTKNDSIRLKIKNKLYNNVPFFSTKCELFMSPVSGAPYTKIASGLQKISNILGENYVTGLRDPNNILETDIGQILNMGVSASQNKATLNTATFRLANLSGQVIVNDMVFSDPASGTYEIYTEVNSYETSQKYLTLQYTYVNNKVQNMKFIVGNNFIESLGIWQEALPYDSIVPIADANPPGLDLSYIKNSSFHTSIFDVNGFSKIKVEEISFVKELRNSTDVAYYRDAGFGIPAPLILVGENINHVGVLRETITAGSAPTVINTYDYHTFVVGDKIFVPFSPKTQTTPGSTYVVESVDVDSITLTTPLFIIEDLEKDLVLSSLPNSVNASIQLATTTDKEKALAYGFTNLMISKTVPLIGINSPTQNIYRQLFISYKPKTRLGQVMTADTYNGDFAIGSAYGANFNETTWQYDNGLVLYISNKLPVYRKWATADEQFVIIL